MIFFVRNKEAASVMKICDLSADDLHVPCDLLQQLPKKKEKKETDRLVIKASL